MNKTKKAIILGQVDKYKKWINRLTMSSQSGRLVMAEYVDADTMRAWTPIIGAYWVQWTLELLSSGFWQTNGFVVYSCRKPVNDNDAGITYSGTWDSFPVAGSLGSTTRRSLVIGDYVTFDITGTTEAYISMTYQSNCGYGYVTIDGGTTLANGSGLSTDGSGNRYFNSYAAVQTAGTRVLIASGLNPASTYTVKVLHSGVKQAEATDHRLYFEGYVIDSYQLDNDTGIAVEKVEIKRLGVETSALEYAYQYKPTGATNNEITGSVHLNEVISSSTLKDENGDDVTLTAEATRDSVTSLVLTNTGTSRHSETTDTDHANVISRVTFNHEGIEVYHKHDWLTNCAILNGYIAMLPSNPLWSTEAKIIGGANLVLTDDDDSYKGQTKNKMAIIWDDATDLVSWIYLPSLLGVNNWSHPSSCLTIQDTAVNNKVYICRNFGSVITVANGDTWESYHRIRVSKYAGVANL